MRYLIRSFAVAAILLAFVAAANAQSGPGPNVRLYCPVAGSNPTTWSPCASGNPLSVNASSSGFTALTTGSPIAVTTSNVSGNLPSGSVVVATNVGSSGAYCSLGASATTSSQFIPPSGGWFAFTVGNSTQLSCITSTGNTTVNMTGGSGLPTGTGGGGGGGGLSVTDQATWTAGTSSFTPGGGFYNATPQALTSGQQGTFALSQYRSLFIDTPTSNSNLYAALTAANAGLTATLPTTNTYTNGATSPLNADTHGALYVNLSSASNSPELAPVAPGAATATKSALIGCQYNSTNITLSNGQQAQVGCGTMGELFVGGGIPSGTTDTGSGGVKIAGVYLTTPPTLTNNQRGDLQLDTRANLNVGLNVSGSNIPLSINGSLSDGSSISAYLRVGAGVLVYNGLNFDRLRNNNDAAASIVTLSAAGAGTVNGAQQVNYNGRGVQVGINLTTVTTCSVVFNVQNYDTVSGQYYTLLSSAALTTTGFTNLQVYPGVTATANVSLSSVLSRFWRVQAVLTGGSCAVTGTVGSSNIL